MLHSQLPLLCLVFLSARFLYSLQITLPLSRLFHLQTLPFLNLHSYQMFLHQCCRYSYNTDILPNFLVFLSPLTYYHFQILASPSFLNFSIILRPTILCTLQMQLRQYLAHCLVFLYSLKHHSLQMHILQFFQDFPIILLFLVNCNTQKQNSESLLHCLEQQSLSD